MVENENSSVFEVFSNSYLMRCISWCNAQVFHTLSLVSREFALYTVLGAAGRSWRKNMKRRFAADCGWTLKLLKSVPCESKTPILVDIWMYQRHGILNDFCGKPAVRLSTKATMRFTKGVQILATDKHGRPMDFAIVIDYVKVKGTDTSFAPIFKSEEGFINTLFPRCLTRDYLRYLMEQVVTVLDDKMLEKYKMKQINVAKKL